MEFLTNEFTYPSASGLCDIFAQSAAPADFGAVKGVVQIAHGMAEYSNRYAQFALELCRRGYAVYINDHLGHGQSVSSEEELGFFGENGADSWLLYAPDVVWVYRVQGRRVKESGVAEWMEEVFVSERLESEKPNRKIFDAALRTLGVENREHVLVVGDSLTSDIQGGANAGLDTCWFNRDHQENPGLVSPTYEIDTLEQLYPIVMEEDELARVGQKNRRHQV